MNIFRNLLDLIYPPRCTICQTFLDERKALEGDDKLPFCRNCFSNFLKIASPLCPICGRPFSSGNPDDHVCEDCLRKRPYFERARGLYLYEGSLVTAIHEFKYGGKTFLARPLGFLLSSFARTWLDGHKNLLVVPVPLHPSRLRERGFNQSLLLAREVVRHMGAELDFLSLNRIRYTKPQTELGSEERRKNVRRAFEVSNREAVKGRTVVLMDDVATTGSTLNECARVLKKAGCQKIYCLVIARTSTA